MIMREAPDLSVVILCYASGESAREFVARTIAALDESGVENYELVLVGNYVDGSNDITPRVVAEIAAGNPRIRYSALPKCGMMGWDMRTGLQMARGNYIAVIDGDGQMPVQDVPRVYRGIVDGDYDLVKTYRTRRGDNAWRKIISHIYNLLFYILFPGLDAGDINSKPKILRRAAYERMELRSDDWFIDAEIMIQARRLGLRICEIPTVFLGLTGRRSFVRFGTLFEFIGNLLVYRIREYRR
jgi:glycosyltransferase involved in cell wall biosynthesis